MDPNLKLFMSHGEPLKDPRRYSHLMGRLSYLTVSRLDIKYAFSVVNRVLTTRPKVIANSQGASLST